MDRLPGTVVDLFCVSAPARGTLCCSPMLLDVIVKRGYGGAFRYFGYSKS
jgi:hypothetical protein